MVRRLAPGQTRSMNETTPPPQTSNRFFTWLRGLGIVRGNDRWFAGVAGGIAAKAGIDPLIVRGIIVVLALLGGPGILLYLAGWVLLPDFSGRIHLENVIRGRASAGVIVTVVILGALVVIPLLFRVLPALFFNPWGWDVWGNVPGLDWVGYLVTILWWVLIVPALIIWFIVWLSRRRSHSSGAGQAGQNGAAAAGAASQGYQSQGYQAQGADQASDASTAPGEHTSTFAEDIGQGANDFANTAKNAANQFGEQASAWGEKVSNDAKEWDRNARTYYETHKLGAAHTVLTLAIALLAAGAAATWAIANSMSNDLVLTIGLLAPVSVLAISAIIAGIRGRGSGWVGFLSFVGVIALIFAPFSSLLPDRTSFVPFGNSTTIATDHEPDNATVMLAGNSTLDLTRLTNGADSREIDVWVLTGNSKIELPATVPVQVHSSVVGGEIRDNRDGGGLITHDEVQNNRERSEGTRFSDTNEPLRQSGLFINHTVGANLEGASASQIIQVNVRLVFGSVRIEGADSSAAPHSQENQTGQPLALGQQKAAELETNR